MAQKFPNIYKWTLNLDIDNKLPNDLWSNPAITNSQKTNLLKLCIGQYMGNARKQFFWHTKIPIKYLLNMQLSQRIYMASRTFKM